jgi:hypothetical protein
MADPEVRDAHDQLDRDAAIIDDQPVGARDEQPAEDGARRAELSLELARADSSDHETMGAANR